MTAPAALDARLEELAAEVRVNFTIPDPAEVRADILAALREAAAMQRECDVEACESEKVDADTTGATDDYAYNQACNDCIAAIRGGAR